MFPVVRQEAGEVECLVTLRAANVPGPLVELLYALHDCPGDEPLPLHMPLAQPLHWALPLQTCLLQRFGNSYSLDGRITFTSDVLFCVLQYGNDRRFDGGIGFTSDTLWFLGLFYLCQIDGVHFDSGLPDCPAPLCRSLPDPHLLLLDQRLWEVLLVLVLPPEVVLHLHLLVLDVRNGDLHVQAKSLLQQTNLLGHLAGQRFGKENKDGGPLEGDDRFEKR